MIDAVIEEVRTSQSAQPSPVQRRLGQLLVDTVDQGRSSGSYEALMLDSLLRDPTGAAPLNLSEFGQRLLTGPVGASDRKQLEVLAQGLERERSEVAGRLRGRG